jgi:transcriptional regulator with XRE-family HTH domain
MTRMEARERLAAWITRAGLTQRAAAKLFGVHYTFLNQILRGRRVPALANAVTIERETGIAPGAWVPTREGKGTHVGTGRASNRRVA